jgi:Na+/H+ antiporter
VGVDAARPPAPGGRAESLINDGTALVILAVALEAATGRAPIGPLGIAWQFVLSYVGGALAGLAVGWLSLQARRRVHDVLMANTVSVLTPFLAFLVAEEIHASGVVAVVVAGIFISQAGSLVITAQDRIRSRAFWQITTFLLNGTLFVLVGLALRGAVSGLTSYSIPAAIRDTQLVGLAVIGTRLAWSNITPYVIRALDRRPQQRLRRVGFRQRQPSALAGFRGAVSLAAALSVPDSVRGRDLIVVVAFGVILLTLAQGLLLPAVLRWAHFEDDGVANEQALAERQALDAALRLLPSAASRLAVDDEIARLVRAELDERHAELSGSPSDPAASNGSVGDSTPRREQYRRLHKALVAEKRATVVRLRNERKIDDIVLRRVEALLDSEELRLGTLNADSDD